MKKTLFIYSEGQDPNSNIYLKMLIKQAEEKDVELIVTDSLDTITNTVKEKNEADSAFDYNYGVLVLQPCSLSKYELYDFFEEIGFKHDIDNVSEKSNWLPATATGIFDNIKAIYPYREKAVIGVIGRGTVGSALINMLIEYGYTVVEVNSATDSRIMNQLLKHCNVIVGLANAVNVLTDFDRNRIESVGESHIYIDSGKNFNFSNKEHVFKCGKWTRGEIFHRLDCIY